MKKVFLTLMMLLLAFTGTMKADELTVNDGTTTSSYVPVYGTWADAYLRCQYVMPAEDLSDMMFGSISQMTFYVSSSASAAWTGTFQVYMTEVEAATISAFIDPATATTVYTGTLDATGATMVVNFDNDYQYMGGNLLVGFDQIVKGNYKGASFYGVSATGASVQGFSSSSLSAISATQRNFLPKTTFTYEPGEVPPTNIIATSTVDLGFRPTGAWMKPYEFEVVNMGAPATVTGVDASTYFAAEAEVPYSIGFLGTMPITITTTGTPADGELNGQVSFTYDNRTFSTVDVKATAYTPIEGDVWETAIVVNEMPYQGNAPAPIYKNYDLPTATAGADAVYKVTFDEDVLFSAGTPGANAAATIYTEDFYGAEGPMADNNYEYVIPSGGGMTEVNYDFETGDLMGWTTIDADGDGETWQSATLDAYSIGSAHSGTYCASSWSWNSYAMYPDNWMISPMVEGATSIQYYVATNNSFPDHYGVYASSTGTNTSDFTLLFDETAGAKGGNGGTKASMTNGGSRDMSTWAERNIELPAGTKYVAFRHWNSDDMNYLFIDDVTITCSAVRGNRDAQTILEEGFEGGSMPTGWSRTGSYWQITSGTGYGSGYTGAANGSYNAGCFINAYSVTDILVTPEMDLSAATSATLNFNLWNTSWSGDINTFSVLYRVDGGDWNTLYTTSNQVSSWLAKEVELTGLAANYQLGFKVESNWSYGTAIDDVLVTAEISSGGGGPQDPVYQIADMFVPAGTYYVVVASTTDNFQVDMAVDAVPVPEPAIAVSPADGAANVASPVTLSWQLGAYTTEYQVLFGTQYPPVNILVDWTDELATSALAGELVNNQSYFWQVNERNASGTTYSEIFAFTSTIDPVEGFAVEEEELYPGDAAVFTWDANRSFKGYNLYCDGVKVNETLITTNTYAVEDLAYNMTGYNFQVAAVYDAGESEWSDAITVRMTGNGTVSGHAYDKPDDDTEAMPIAYALVQFSGLDEYGEAQTFVLTADEEGAFTGEILAGAYAASVITEGYDSSIAVPGVLVNYNDLTDGIDIYTHEFYYPLSQITATEVDDDVLVEWSWNPAELIVDFETGDFSQAEFTLPATYPWTICNNAHEGTYAIKSTCEGQASASSIVEATVDVPYDGKMGFWVSVSSESNYDKFHFYIDGVEKGAALSGNVAYTYKEFDVTEGTHTYKWEYTKDSSVNSNDDCAYVDDITMYRYEAPLPPVVGATTYDFDDNTMMGWTSIDADNDGNGWVSSANPGIYHNSGVSLSGTGHNASEAYVISGSYANQTGAALTPDNYLVAPAAISAENGAQIHFFACAQDANYAAEHFGVAVSTTTATASAFTTVQEWTLTAKGNGMMSVGREGQTRAQGNWYEYVVDLSSYAGQDIWVAIRHFNCTDMFILNVDDITVATGGTKTDRGNRSMMSYNLYRRNLTVSEDPGEPIASGIDPETYEYTDAEWSTLSYGEYQWGIQATYEGYAAVPERTVASSAERNADDNANSVSSSSASYREMWDLVYSFDGTSGYQYGVATDGNYIYTSSWSSSSTSMFYKYDMEGNFVEEFNISGCGQLRGMTYDGQYFYGVANANTVYCVDLANHALISSFTTTYGAMRCITYDPVRDGFWVVGNWSGNLTLISRTGAIVQEAAAPNSASDVAYYMDENNVEHVYYVKNDSGYGEVYDYNITTNTMGTTPMFDCSTTTAWTGSSGGCFVAEYDGKTCFFADCQQSPQLICIYELNASSTPLPPTPVPAGNGLSEIIWSNVIEKDMEATLTFNITLNNGQSPAGASIVIDGIENDYNAVAEGATTEIVVRKGDMYEMFVTLDGYVTPDGYSSWAFADLIEDDATYDIELNEDINAPVENLYVSPTGWAKWDGIGGTPAPGPGPQPGGSSFTEGFESGMPAGWNVIDGNNDGWTWCLTSAIPSTWTYYASMSLDWYRTGTNAICSGSYINGVGALTPNEYLVMGQQSITAGSTLSFYAAATDASYPADHFGVCVSDNGTSDWTVVDEWTLTAKGTRNGGRESRDGNGAKLGNWYQFTANLDAYAGTTKYIAIRHFNCNDQYIMVVDDIELSVVNKGDEDAPIKYIVKLDGVVDGETTFNGFQHNVEGMEEGSTHVTAVRPVYINGNGPWSEYTWTYTSCENFAGVDDLAAAQQGNDVKLTWTMPGTPGPGPGPGPGGSSFTEDFEGGLNGWNVLTMIADGGSWIHSNDNLGGYDYTELAHGGTGFAMCYSFVDYVGAFNTDSYMYTPEMYTISNGSTLTFWADNANDSYPENFSVVVSTVANPASAADFTTVWSGGAKGTRSNGAMVRHSNNRYNNWRQHTVDLSAYAGQTVYIGFHDVNYDMYEVWIDDVELTSGAKLGGTLSAAGVGFGTANNVLTDDGNWYYYDNGTNEDAIGTGGGQFWWGIMLPAGDYEGNSLTKVAAYDYMAMTGTASIYQGGTTAPEGAALGTVNVTMTGSENFVEYEFAEPVAIDPTQNVWVIFYNASGATYPAAVCNNTGDANGRWVSLDGASWDDLAGYGLDYTFMVRAYIEAGSGPAPQPVEGILGAMIFQDDEPIAFVAGYPTEYVVEGAASYDATYAVRVVYGGEPDVTYYAMSCPDEVVYIAPSVSVEEISANTVIYPNPTHDNVTIEAKGMRHITVVSALGQVVYDADIEADMTQMNLGQFKAGLYLVRIATENGTVVKRVTVVK